MEGLVARGRFRTHREDVAVDGRLIAEREVATDVEALGKALGVRFRTAGLRFSLFRALRRAALYLAHLALGSKEVMSAIL